MRLQQLVDTLRSMVRTKLLRDADEVEVLVSPECRRIVHLFRNAGAISAQSAQRFHPRSQAEAHAFAHLLATFTICQPAWGLYFLDERLLREMHLALLTFD